MTISLGPTLEFICYVFTCYSIAWIIWHDKEWRDLIELIIEAFGPGPRPPTKKG